MTGGDIAAKVLSEAYHYQYVSFHVSWQVDRSSVQMLPLQFELPDESLHNRKTVQSNRVSTWGS
eukprot:1036403-Prorocentrum_minimum.AAC.1